MINTNSVVMKIYLQFTTVSILFLFSILDENAFNYSAVAFFFHKPMQPVF